MRGKHVKRAGGSPRGRQKQKKGAYLLAVITVVLVAIFCFSIYKVIDYLVVSHREKDTFTQLAAQVQSVDDGSGNGTAERNGAGILMKYADLYAQNPDFAGWIRIEGTVIDYPVMYTPEDCEKYLHLDFNGEYSYSGVPFIDAGCDPFSPSDNVIIYGHDMKNGEMFGSLSDYETVEFWKEHQFIQFDTIYEEGTYQVIAAFYTSVASPEKDIFPYYTFFNARDAADFDNYVSKAKILAPYDTMLTAAYGDKLLTLSTCSSHAQNGRFVVVAKRVD